MTGLSLSTGYVFTAYPTTFGSSTNLIFVFSPRTPTKLRARQVAYLKGLRALREEGKLEHYVAVTLEKRPRTVDGIRVLPWSDFLDQLWESAYC